MNPNTKEGLKQQFEHFKDKALFVLTTALRAPLILMMGCGYVTNTKTFSGRPAEVHDHDGEMMVHRNWNEVPYDPKIHGYIVDFLKEGEPLPHMPKSTDGETAIHRHSYKYRSNGGKSGAHEYQYE
jgi:hypothetical protein